MLFLLLTTGILCQSVFAQTIDLPGKVLDQDGEPDRRVRADVQLLQLHRRDHAEPGAAGPLAGLRGIGDAARVPAGRIPRRSRDRRLERRRFLVLVLPGARCREGAPWALTSTGTPAMFMHPVGVVWRKNLRRKFFFPFFFLKDLDIRKIK